MPGLTLPGPQINRDYLHDQKGRNCRPSTMRSNCSTLMIFLLYLKEKRGRASLETITRDDVSSFIEHEQDRGMQPNTLSTMLRLFYAFLRYLVDRELVHPDLLKRKLRVKVPEALPRAMYLLRQGATFLLGPDMRTSGERPTRKNGNNQQCTCHFFNRPVHCVPSFTLQHVL